VLNPVEVFATVSCLTSLLRWGVGAVGMVGRTKERRARGMVSRAPETAEDRSRLALGVMLVVAAAAVVVFVVRPVADFCAPEPIHFTSISCLNKRDV
jgi:hypothetical protein